MSISTAYLAGLDAGRCYNQHSSNDHGTFHDKLSDDLGLDHPTESHRDSHQNFRFKVAIPAKLLADPLFSESEAITKLKIDAQTWMGSDLKAVIVRVYDGHIQRKTGHEITESQMKEMLTDPTDPFPSRIDYRTFEACLEYRKIGFYHPLEREWFARHPTIDPRTTKAVIYAVWFFVDEGFLKGLKVGIAKRSADQQVNAIVGTPFEKND